MLTRDIVHSCANSKVAAAALASIGGAYSARISLIAAESGLEPGAFISAMVRDFARQASGGDWARLENSLRCSDFPLLQGLRHIIDTSLSRQGQDMAESNDKAGARQAPAVWKGHRESGPTLSRCN
ncbi:MAG: hypothetical protein KGQ46_06150 [Hyphomicrobiales bacterium]|nr:hypothetical protein [Hyphomicrobiales bacterium]MDE2114750.1 hypothetical protein [Hyphomicrobiales bacterium]